MRDKLSDPTVKLFVRVPASFKRRLAMSATAQRTSVAKELVRLLDERLESGLSETLKRRHNEFQRSQSEYMIGFLKRMLDNYEDNLLHCIEQVRLGDTSALDSIYNQILTARNARKREFGSLAARTKREESRALHEQALRDEADKLGGVSVFDTQGENKDLQLPVEERRRLNLIDYLATKPRGIKKQLAIGLGWKNTARVTHILTEKGRHGHRPISTKLAESIASVLNIDVGVLDKMESDRQMAELTHSLGELKKTLNELPTKKRPRSKTPGKRKDARGKRAARA